ncbi:permease-like cell division protein FtsX [Candidatus Solincola tengchongensis]|uniref:permease-like cell division protein FtsX n=1 Tax=Candidatus Solincola tengchongensis TaxID=2900693 RepID=UPI00257A9CE6|nr:permease-like cell division protein FtsX [Candidatus Solincola tengchongensis]
MNKIKYFAGETWASLRKNIILAIAAIAVVTVSLGILGLVVMGWNMFSNMIKNAERKVGEVDVYLSDLTTQEELQAIEAFLASIPEVDAKSIYFKSKDEALREFKERFKDQPELWEYIDENPLPNSYQLMTKDPKDVGVVVGRINNEAPYRERIEDIKSASSAIEKLENIFDKFRQIGTVAVIALALVAVLLVSVTIQVAIFARRREIGIMKLVGATNWFIRWPFVLEGVFEGLSGSLAAILVVMAVKVWILDRLIESLQFLRLSFSSGLFAVLVPCILVGGVVIGALGSAYALGRFLEV